jgi:branched-chain amino acid transport system substrate-binding protein
MDFMKMSERHQRQATDRERRLRPLAALLAVMLFSFLPAQAAEPLRIAAIFSQTGIAASHNAPLLTMTELAVAEINAHGGLLGRQLELVKLDNQSTPIGATMAAKKAVELGAIAVIGAHWSSHSLAMAPVLQKAGVPMISPGSTNPEVTRTGSYIFRACFLDSFQGMAMARFARDELKADTAVVLRNIDEAYSIMLADFFLDAFRKQGGTILADLEYRGNAIDFRTSISRIKELAPDIVYLPGYTRDSGLLIKQARGMGITAVFLGGDAWDEIEQYAGSSIDGSYQSAPWHPEVPYQPSRELQRLYRRHFNAPITNLSAPLAYDAVNLLAEAIRRAGSTDRARVRDALANLENFEGATGTFSFDDNGDPENKKVIIIRFQDGNRTFHKAISP